MTFMKLLMILPVWTGCLLPYLASSRQQLLLAKLPKVPAWIGFCLLQVFAIWGLSSFYGTMAASLIVLMLVMCMWIGLVLLASHLARRLMILCIIAIGFFSLIALSGIAYVA